MCLSDGRVLPSPILRYKHLKSICEGLGQDNHVEFDPRKYLGPARDNMEKLYKHKIVNVLGSENKLAQLD